MSEWKRKKGQQAPLFTTQVQVSARSDYPYGEKPRKADDVADVPEVATAPPDSGNSMEKVATRALTRFVKERKDAYKGAETRSLLSEGGWKTEPRMGMPTEFRNLYDAQLKSPPPPMPAQEDFDRLRSPEAISLTAEPYRDPTLTALSQNFASQAAQYRDRAEQLRNKHPLLRRFIPLINNNLNTQQVNYQALASQADANELQAMQSAAAVGEQFRRRQALENQAYLAGILDTRNRYVTDLTAIAGQGNQLYNQAGATQLGEARTDLERGQLLNNPNTILGVAGLSSLMKLLNEGYATNVSAFNASPERLARVAELEDQLKRMGFASQAANVQQSLAAANASAAKTKEFTESQLPPTMQAMKALERDGLEEWVRNQGQAARVAFIGKDAPTAATENAVTMQMEQDLAAAYDAAYAAALPPYNNPTFRVNRLADTYLDHLYGGKPLSDEQQAVAIVNVQKLLPPKYMSDLLAREGSGDQTKARAYAADQSRRLATKIVMEYQRRLEQGLSGK